MHDRALTGRFAFCENAVEENVAAGQMISKPAGRRVAAGFPHGGGIRGRRIGAQQIFSIPQ
jgi:hypothetical protein